MSPRKLLAVLCAALMSLVMLPAGAPVVSAVEDAVTVEGFMEGTERLELFTDNLGSGFQLELPAKARVKEARLTLEGILPPTIKKYDVGTDPLSVVGTDVDGDGDVDIGVANSKSDTISILLNDGQGDLSKTKALSFGVDPGPQDLVLKDLDHDGTVDLATANYDDGSVTVRLSRVEMFGSTNTYSIGGSPLFIEGEDMDGDSHVDLVVVRKEFPAVSLLFNKGDGTFNPAIDVQVDAFGEGVVTGDWDGDGDRDIAVASSNRPFSVITIMNKGSKDFQEGDSYNVEWPPSDIVAADIYGDGDLDLVVSSAEPTGNISVFKNLGPAFETTPAILAFPRQKALFPVDLNSDGRPDLVSTTRIDSTVRTFMNTMGGGGGTGGGAPFELDQLFIMGNNPNDIFLADLDGDGDPDLVTADLAGNSVSSILNNGRGRFTWYDTYDIHDSDKMIGKGDLDGDGDTDIISSNYNQQTVTLAYNTGRGTFDDYIVRDGYKVYAGQGGSGGSEPFYISTADYDGDGDIDVEYGEELSYSIILMFNKGDGRQFDEKSVAFVNDSNLLSSPPYITLPDDIDGDGDLDIVTNHINHDYLSILINDGKGFFRERINFSMEGDHPYDLVAEDIDGDGDNDFVTANFGVALDYENNVSFVRNDGGGAFTNLKKLALKKGPRSLHFADFNGDGRRDIVVAFAARKGLSDIVPGEVAILLAKEGVAEFNDPVYYRAGILPGSVFATDLNEDGAPDVICLNQGTGSGGSISILINKGDGSFNPQILYPFVPFATSVYDDFLGDGRQELVLPILSTHIAIYRALYYPGEVGLTVGTSGVSAWQGTDLLEDDIDVNLTGPLNEVLKGHREADGEEGTVVVPFDLRAGKAGIVRVSGLVVTYTLGEEEEDGEERLGLDDPATIGLIILLIILVLVSLAISAPRAPEEVVAAAARRGKRTKKKGKGKGKKKGKGKRKRVAPKEEGEDGVEPPVKVEVIRKGGKKHHKDLDDLKRLDKAVKVRDSLKKR